MNQVVKNAVDRKSNKEQANGKVICGPQETPRPINEIAPPCFSKRPASGVNYLVANENVSRTLKRKEWVRPRKKNFPWTYPSVPYPSSSFLLRSTFLLTEPSSSRSAEFAEEWIDTACSYQGGDIRKRSFVSPKVFEHLTL